MLLGYAHTSGVCCRDDGIFVRRYFYPLISEFPMYRGLPSASQSNLPVAAKLAQQVLCLPIYPGLRDDQVDRILELLRGRFIWSAK